MLPVSSVKGFRGVLETDYLLLNCFMPCNAGMKIYWQISVVIFFFQGLQFKKSVWVP